ncbi:CatA-like O-acetyltransferase [Ferrimonas balearica]|uniref:CatA-like O-acetyltransferase n=1 Tax=Ferrimonas balearica TaxID=44012 RepID=UPI001C9920BA|nr:CatA-like O-acetyltransferase [Ferrimonas balearica]MBY5993719.1 hypothetical protein [Ferrimonas balearica]
MRVLSPETFPRQQQFDHFQQVAVPYVGICADVEVQALLALCRAEGWSAYRATLYAIAQVAEELEWLRWRIRDGQVICHDRLDSAITVLGEDNQVRFTTVPWQPDWPAFDRAAQKVSAEAAASTALYNGNPAGDEDDDLLYHSCVPWLRFTQMIQPMPLNPACSIPRIMWGKYDVQGARTLMPVVIQAHHALADGLHLAQFFQVLQRKLDEPGLWLRS